jgi:selenide,water dikinase
MVSVMRSLNREAAEAMVEIGAHACTDVTGFGLLGHLREMAVASGLDVSLSIEEVPILEGARDLAGSDIVPGGTVENLHHVEAYIDWAPALSRVDRLLLADAQTSGGLLIALAEDEADRLLTALHERGVSPARRIGRFEKPGQGRIRVQ